MELARSENQVVANNNAVPQYWLIYWGILDFIGVIWLNILALAMGEMDINLSRFRSVYHASSISSNIKEKL